MKKKLIGLFGLSSIVLGFTPLMALAAIGTCYGVGTGINSSNLQGIICTIGNILDIIIPILIVLAVIYFIWGVVMFVISSDEEAKTKGRTHMIYGLIGLVVIVAFWGLVGIVRNTFGIGGGSQSPNLPAVQY